MANDALLDRIHLLNEIGVALSTQKEGKILLEKILQGAKQLTHADGGSIYTVSPEKKLHFEILWTDSLHYHLGGSSKERVPFEDLPLFLENGAFNEKMVATYAANHKTLVHIKDVYQEEGFDFSGTRAFDQKLGYRTKAVLVVPIKNHEDDVIAVLQLINPLDPYTGKVTSFTSEDIHLAESLASQAGVALSNFALIKDLRLLFESFVEVIAKVIDKRSPSTGNHSRRVPLLVDLFAKAINQEKEGSLAKVHFTDEELYELKLAALLHDCGKIAMASDISEKKSKLGIAFDRFELIELRYEILKKLKGDTSELEEQKNFLRRLNRQEEAVTEAVKERVYAIAKQKWKGEEPFLTQEEIECLLIERGNLTFNERKMMESHVLMTIEMLRQLIYPKNLARIPEIAGAHHERIDGKGYPNQLKGDEMSNQARLLAIADVFEALSSPDRPYKKSLSLSKVLKIMQEMADEGHLDKELFSFFCKKKIYLHYAHSYLSPEQIDVS